MDQRKLKKEIENFLDNLVDRVIPQLSIDCVIFAFDNNQLKVLLLEQYKTVYGLPSGFIFQDEDVDAAALRSLRESTGLDQVFLKQFHAFGSAKRYFLEEMSAFLKHLEVDLSKADWLLNRFVSIGYYALVDHRKTKPRGGFFSEGWIWADVQELPKVGMDHVDMIHKALECLKRDIVNQPIGLQLLPDTFTMPELHRLYELILDRPIDRRNFRKKMLQLNILKALKEKEPILNKEHRSKVKYQFDREKYLEVLGEEVKLGF